MYDPNSQILNFYPFDFELDLNGKKQDLEAIVKIPFIDGEWLLKAMGKSLTAILRRLRLAHLSPQDDKSRDGIGQYILQYAPKIYAQVAELFVLSLVLC